MLQSIIPSPLHPAVVHMPMALTVLVPFFAVGALWAIRKGARPVRAWGVAVAMFGALSLSSWVSLETGEDADEKVESVVPEAAIATHEQAAEQFLILTAVLLSVAAVGLLNGKAGKIARVAASVGTLGVVVAGWNVGHSGGALVYRYGAATAYVADSAGTVAGPARARADSDGDDK